jgi:hypothetical protein
MNLSGFFKYLSKWLYNKYEHNLYKDEHYDKKLCAQ